MKKDLNFLGIGSAFNPALGNNAAWFTHNNALFIIDCGWAVFEQIWQLPELKSATDIYVLITHLHGDHVGSLGTFINACAAELGKQPQIIHQQATINQLLSLMGVLPTEYVYHPTMPLRPGLLIEAVPVVHTDDMQAYGYVITMPEWTIYFSGDASQIPPQILTRFLAGEIEQIYQDTSIYEDKPHASLTYLDQIIPLSERKRFYCVHLEAGAKEAVLAKGFCIPDQA